MPRQHEPPLTSQTILWLQTTSGNRAVQRLLAHKAMERAREQQLMVIKVEPQQLEILPELELPATLAHLSWWRLLLHWLFKQRVR
jgi:hypothetical protein